MLEKKIEYFERIQYLLKVTGTSKAKVTHNVTETFNITLYDEMRLRPLLIVMFEVDNFKCVPKINRGVELN